MGCLKMTHIFGMTRNDSRKLWPGARNKTQVKFGVFVPTRESLRILTIIKNPKQFGQ